MPVGLKNVEIATGYIPKAWKSRLRKIRKLNPDLTESRLIRMGLQRIMEEVDPDPRTSTNPQQSGPVAKTDC